MNTIIHYSDDPHVGRFDLPPDVERPIADALIRSCRAVISIEPHESGHGTTVTAAHPGLFDALHEGEEVPHYRVEFAVNGVPMVDPALESRRFSAGGFGFAAVRRYIVRVPAAMMKLYANG
jgi:hypothetical protein